MIAIPREGLKHLKDAREGEALRCLNDCYPA